MLFKAMLSVVVIDSRLSSYFAFSLNINIELDRQLAKPGKRSCSVVDQVQCQNVIVDHDQRKMKIAEATLPFLIFFRSTYFARFW
jgi:hypothetical protein